VLAYTTGPSGANVGRQIATPDRCTSPSSFTFGGLVPVAAASPPPAQPAGRMAVVFGQGGGLGAPSLDPIPRLDFATSVDFGSVPVGDIATRTLTIRNTSEVPATVSLPAAPPGVFRWDGFDGALACGGTTAIAVEFGPPAQGQARATLGFTSDAAGSPHAVRLMGRGIGGVEPR
jgi:hypothetical protein